MQSNAPPRPHPSILASIARMSYRDARKWLRSHGCSRAEQDAFIRAAKATAQSATWSIPRSSARFFFAVGEFHEQAPNGCGKIRGFCGG
jgi:hypothetical protein